MAFLFTGARFLRDSPRVLAVLAALLGLSFIATVLVPGFELATDLADGSVSLRWISEQQRDLASIPASLNALHDRLDTRGYIEDALGQLHKLAESLDTALGAPAAAKRSLALRSLWT